MRSDLKAILHPYLLVLKEKTARGKNPMNFSLLMLQVGAPELLKSPKKQQKKTAASFQDMEAFTQFFSSSSAANQEF